jgi:deoxyribodipyrimidine photolyase-related protein
VRRLRLPPGHRNGDRACPCTAGYWAFLHRHRARLEHNPRMARTLRGLDRLADLPKTLDTVMSRGPAAP